MKKFKIFMYSLLALLIIPCALLFVACGKEGTASAETCSVILVVDGHQYKTEEVEKGTVLTEAKLTELLGITKIGYTFNGWYRDGNLTEQYNYDTAVTSPIVLFSEYRINKYSLTYVLGNGADDIVVREDYGAALETPARPVRPGYTFVGWDKDVPETMPAQDTTITASWREFTVSVESNIEGACTLADYTVTNVLPGVEDIGGTLNVDVTSVNMGYTFVGWYEGTNRVSLRTKYSHTIENKNTVLVAKFEVDEGLENFTFVSTPESLTITGVVNKNLTELAFPAKTTNVEEGALAGMTNLQKLEIPFVGSSLASALHHPFGYLFTTTNPNNEDVYVDLGQRDEYYKEDGKTAYTTKHYYVPLSLTELVLNPSQTTYGTYVFEKLNLLTNLDKITYKGTMSQWMSTTFSGQASNPMNSLATKFYYLDENNQPTLLQTLVVPENIKEFKPNSFIGFDCLQKVVIHSGLKKVLKDAFKGFVAGSIEFYYVGTPTQWEENVTITSGIGSTETDLTKSGNAVLIAPGALIYYYSETRPSTEELATNTYWYYDEHHELQLWS